MANLYSNRFTHRGRRIGNEPITRYSTQSGKTLAPARILFDDPRGASLRKGAHRENLREAVAFAQMAENEEVYINRAREIGSTPYNIAIVDWFGAPRVLEIDVDGWTGKPGEIIRVKARDNVAVVGVSVVIRDTQNHVLEEGEAIQVKAGGAWWHYTTQTRVTLEPFPTVEATAQDLRGNADTFAVS
jgi:hypothetical protein